MRFLIIGGSDAGIAAGLRARELDPSCDITFMLADEFPNYSICGLPFYLSGETPDWHSLAHRTEFPGIKLLPNHTAENIDAARKVVLARRAEPRRPVATNAIRNAFLAVGDSDEARAFAARFLQIDEEASFGRLMLPRSPRG